MELDADGLWAFLERTFPAAVAMGFTIEAVAPEGVTLALSTRDEHLRPGGTISGPTLMTLADTAAYLSILAHRGPVALAVTSSLQMHFLAKPEPGRLRAGSEILRLSRGSAVVRVDLWQADQDLRVATSTVTYAIPRPSRGEAAGG